MEWIQTEDSIYTQNQEVLCYVPAMVSSVGCTFRLTHAVIESFCIDPFITKRGVYPNGIPPGSVVKNTGFNYIKRTIFEQNIKVRGTLSWLKRDQCGDSCHFVSLLWTDNSRQF